MITMLAVGMFIRWAATSSINDKIKFMKIFISVVGCGIIAAVILTSIVILF
jgi:hypothetical protein